MKIVTAFAARSEVETLTAAGADELYCGMVPEAFLAAPSQGRLNRRYEPDANIRDLVELTEVVACAAAAHVPVAVAVNEHAYEPATIPALVDLAGLLVTAGVRALIASDLGLILAIRRAGLPIDLHLSSVATCSNSEAAAFFAETGIRRVILPRYLSTRQIARLCAAGVPVDYEVFAINDGCGFEEGLCLNLHRPWGPMCQMDWRAEPRSEAPPPPGFAEAWQENWRAYRQLMGLLDHPGGTVSGRGFPNGPCGVCALPALSAAGVGYVKIPGREYSPELRLGGLKLVRAVLDWVERGDPPEAVAANARALKDTPLLCDSTYTCYFREGVDTGRGRAAGGPPVTLADLDAAARFQHPTPGTPGSLPSSDAAAPAPAPAEQPTGPAGRMADGRDPEIARVRRIGRALSVEGIDLRWSEASFEIVLRDEDQPEGTSRVTLAKVEGSARCYARSGSLGLWHSGQVVTPRMARVIEDLMRLLALDPPR